MKKEVIYELKSLYRDPLRITGYSFGTGKESVCIVGAMRGNEIQQIYVCSQIIQKLQELERNRQLDPQKKIMVIPSINHYSMNIAKRFWAQDDTDINRMFPGYNEGETTQRIAEGVFRNIKDYQYGIQFTSFYIPGEFATHIRMMKTGLEDIEDAKLFGLPYIVVRKPRPYDTTTLNYNWQIWNCKAYSLYTKDTDIIDEASVKEAVSCVLRFLYHKGISHYKMSGGYISEIVGEDQMLSLKSTQSGILKRMVEVNDEVEKGQILALILDPYEGTVLEKIYALKRGTVFFVHSQPLVYSQTAVVKLKLID